ncbi:phenylalanine--tRNA ligase subunit beta [Aureisphaera sp. CAU 1614]|uniref:Phenylalanine--tRNA ligase beta subunit n=1 Tax=Halomarinibacterium sedimenti TaxID=2857106 RepID=A0A9X1FPF8_9FLAO|nr:phenylalanine--tRNA ligase subunit beta [Halomarinibacterium sedimenti]MBW2938196.1 phenylalanine--tRNA ligase subunit beta [Halomarinibacterium sedimenti]
MKISYNWLKKFIKVNQSPEETGELLTDLGLEIEGIEAFTSVPGGLEGIVVGHVLECIQHPDADRLKLTKVDVGNGTPLQIVCGAPNVAVGQKVPVATIGTTLYDADKNPWTIKKGKIRGEESQGMICAEDELHIGTSHDGIMVLDAQLKPGTLFSEVIGIENDHIFEIGLTPNRADAMSHWGVARDLRAGLLQNGVSLELITPSTSSFHVNNRSLKIDVSVENNELAPRYCGVTIKNLKVAASPTWLQNRLKSIGLSPINNVVDITNYILHELGQPLHAFDASKINGGKVIVKTLPEGTLFTTLDGVERKLDKEDLMICDTEKPMCIAGVFGGIDSGVTETTTSIFLESAYFNPISVRKTAKRHGLNTDASFRFERGIDPNITEYALMVAAIMMEEIAGGEISSDVVDIYPKKIEDHQVFLSYENTARLIGEEIPKETIKQILTSLEIKINNVTETGIGITIPAYRNDVTREADVIEEVLRVYGYNRIKTSTKLNASMASVKRIEDYKVQDKVGGQLTALGFHEMLNNSLTNEAYYKHTQTLRPEHSVKMLNPLSKDLEILRQSMLFGGLESLAFNANRRIENIKLFEFGKTYHQFPNNREEHKHLSLIVSGNKTTDTWAFPSQKTSFFYLKGVVQSILQGLGISGYVESDVKNDIFSEGILLQKNKKLLVEFGIVSKKIAKHFSIETELLYADFHWDQVLQELTGNNVQVTNIPKFPKVKRDFALLLDDEVRFENLKLAALQTEKHLLKEVSLFDVYTGKNLPKGKKSYALSFTIQDENKTLTDKQIDKIMAKLQQTFEKEFGATLR